MKYVKKRMRAKAYDEEEEIRKLTLKEIMTEPRWSMIWMLFQEKKKLFPDLPDDLLLETLKQEIIKIRQIARTGLL